MLKLANPIHDAEDIAVALRGFGFEVIERKNQGKEDDNIKKEMECYCFVLRWFSSRRLFGLEAAVNR